jgi:hypothetical protein
MNQVKKRRYKVHIVKEGESKTHYIDFVWARSTKEAERIVRDKKRRSGEKVLKIEAGALD